MLAEGVGGSIDGFSAMMNQTAQKLGMTQTSYVNPNGLPADGQITSARDLAILARAVIRDAGYGEWFVHRTGHSIDRDLHGSGPHLDNFETGDDRQLVAGIGFSVEPGIYLPERFGMRTEINVFLGETGPEVTPREPQRELLLV